MKISSTAPCRISLFGGGSDIYPYAQEHGGLVISMAINLRQKVTMYSEEDLYEVSGKNVFPYGSDPNFYYKIWEEFGINDMHLTKVTSTFDGLIEAGLGSSASAAVAMIGAINKRLDLKMTTQQIAEKAWEIEVNKIVLFGGKQDQYAAAFGGVNCFEFKDKVNVIPLAKGFIEPLIPSLVLCYTGKNRKSAVIQEGFKSLTKQQINKLDGIKSLAVEAATPISEGNYEKVGKLLNYGWELKKASNSNVSNPEINFIFNKALRLGAYGGKLLGAGGGGFMLFIVDPDKRQYFIDNIGLEYWDFSICWNGLEVRDITNK